jgi:hypothetical protein
MMGSDGLFTESLHETVYVMEPGGHPLERWAVGSSGHVGLRQTAQQGLICSRAVYWQSLGAGSYSGKFGSTFGNSTL